MFMDREGPGRSEGSLVMESCVGNVCGQREGPGRSAGSLVMESCVGNVCGQLETGRACCRILLARQWTSPVWCRP